MIALQALALVAFICVPGWLAVSLLTAGGEALDGREKLLLTACLVAAAVPAHAQWAIESKDGNSSIKFGFLVQGWAETYENPDGEDSANNLYFRRLRLLAGGKITPKFTFFMETDSPNLGKGKCLTQFPRNLFEQGVIRND